MNANANSDTLWTIVVAAWLCLMIFIGGTSLPSPIMLAVQSVISIVLVAVSLWRLRDGLPGKLAMFGVLLAVLVFLAVAAHLAPLPPTIWQNLPGRALVTDTMSLSGSGAERWMPLSLAPQMTKLALLALLPPLATFLAFLSFDRRDLPAIGAVLILAAIGCVMLGLLQRNAGPESALHFYGYRGEGKSTGTFGNPNFFATQLFASIPFLAALAMTLQERFAMRGWLVFLFAAAYAAVVLVGLGVTGSRAGIVFAMVSVFATVLVVYRASAANHNKKFGILPFVVIGSLLILGQVGMAGLLQLTGSDPLADYRSVMVGVSIDTLKAFFPFGSGFGSFVPVYQMHETPETMLNAYVNHAHNDWLEIILEGGLASVVLLLGFVVLFLAGLVAVFRLASDSSVNAYFRAAAVALFLILLHSVIDYPLRTPTISVIAAACFALMLTARSTGTQFAPTRRQQGKKRVTEPAAIRPFSRPDRAFRKTPQPQAANLPDEQAT